LINSATSGGFDDESEMSVEAFAIGMLLLRPLDAQFEPNPSTEKNEE
jgi:hypothetical protein